VALITTLTKSTELVDGKNALNYLFLAMAHWQLGNKTEAEDWYNKAIEWIENGNNGWLNVQGQMICDIHLEASEPMGIETREF